MKVGRGFVGVATLIAIVSALIVITGGAYYFMYRNFPVTPATQNYPENAAQTSASTTSIRTQSVSNISTNLAPTQAASNAQLVATSEPEQASSTILNNLSLEFDYENGLDPLSGPAPLDVNFSNLTSPAPYVTPSGSTQELDFGDGQKIRSDSNGYWPVQYVKHVYSSPGTYTVTLADVAPYSVLDRTTITVTSASTSSNDVTFTATPITGVAPLVVTFQAGFSEPFSQDNQGINKFTIDTGDGGIRSIYGYGDNGIPINYQNPGTYTAVLQGGDGYQLIPLGTPITITVR